MTASAIAVRSCRSPGASGTWTAGRAGDLHDDRVGLERAPGVDDLVAAGAAWPAAPARARRRCRCRSTTCSGGTPRRLGDRADQARWRTCPGSGSSTRAASADHLEHAGQRRVRVLVRRDLVGGPGAGRCRPPGPVGRDTGQRGPDPGLGAHRPSLGMPGSTPGPDPGLGAHRPSLGMPGSTPGPDPGLGAHRPSLGMPAPHPARTRGSVLTRPSLGTPHTPRGRRPGRARPCRPRPDAHRERASGDGGQQGAHHRVVPVHGAGGVKAALRRTCTARWISQRGTRIPAASRSSSTLASIRSPAVTDQASGTW